MEQEFWLKIIRSPKYILLHNVPYLSNKDIQYKAPRHQISLTVNKLSMLLRRIVSNAYNQLKGTNKSKSLPLLVPTYSANLDFPF